MGQWCLCAIPVPMRQRILALYEQGESTVEMADALGFCVAAVRRVRQQFKARGTLEPQTHLCGRQTLLDPTPPSSNARTWPNKGRAGMSN